MTTVHLVLERAQHALRRSTLYWLGEGGRDPQAQLPASSLAVGRLWPTLPAAQRLELEPLAQAQGINVHDPDLVRNACDCSGYVCWALGLPRQVNRPPFSEGGGWIFTDSIWADAMGPNTLFRRLDRAKPGALLVFPKQGSGRKFGHVGIVVDTDGAGRATRIAHCSAENAMNAPFDAIQITPADLFDQFERSIVAWPVHVG